MKCYSSDFNTICFFISLFGCCLIIQFYIAMYDAEINHRIFHLWPKLIITKSQWTSYITLIFCFSSLGDNSGTLFQLMLSTVMSGFHGVPVEKVLYTLWLRKKRLNWVVLQSRSEKTEALCHCWCDMIKTPPCYEISDCRGYALFCIPSTAMVTSHISNVSSAT